MTKEVLHIRRYRAADREEVWRVHNDALRETGAHLGNGPWDDDLHDIEDVYFDDGGEFLVGICDGQLVAMGALKRTSSERAEITRMRVDPAFQRHGFGRAILASLEKRAVELGYSTLRLDTTVQQEAARSLYTKNGYREMRRGRVGPFETVIYEKSGFA